jgi:hypothetical protein
MVMSFRSKWAAGKAVRAGLAVGGRIPLQFSFCHSPLYHSAKKLGRDLTDEQRSRRPIFNATFWAAASWLFFGAARSARINPEMGALPPARLGPP